MAAQVIRLVLPEAPPEGGPVVQVKKRTLWPLRTACDLALETHWKGKRKYAHVRGWCEELCRTFPDKTLHTLTTEDLITYDRMSEADGLGDEARKARMSVVSVLYSVAQKDGYAGPVPYVPRPYVTRKLKWWMPPDLEVRILRWLGEMGKEDTRDFIRWTVETGLRVEESLKVTIHCFINLNSDKAELVVPGTKTARSQATHPLNREATEIARRRFSKPGRTALFEMDYMALWQDWQLVRLQFGLMGISTATLKAIRRSYARRRTVRGTPLPVLQQLMRHGAAATTLGYMQLVGGGFSAEEMRQWVENQQEEQEGGEG